MRNRTWVLITISILLAEIGGINNILSVTPKSVDLPTHMFDTLTLFFLPVFIYLLIGAFIFWVYDLADKNYRKKSSKLNYICANCKQRVGVDDKFCLTCGKNIR